MSESHRKIAKRLDKGVDLVRPERSSKPHLPHERDEATGATGGVASGRVHQGFRDLQRGVQDTSRAPEADQACRDLKRKAARVNPRGGRGNTP